MDIGITPRRTGGDRIRLTSELFGYAMLVAGIAWIVVAIRAFCRWRRERHEMDSTGYFALAGIGCLVGSVYCTVGLLAIRVI